MNPFQQASFLGVGVITCALHAQGRRFDPGRKQSVSVCRILCYEEISLYSFVVVLLLAGLRGNQTCFCWHSVLLHFETSSSVCLFKLSSGVRGFFICLRVGTHNFFTYADMGLCGFPTFKPSNRPSILKLEQTSSRGVYQSSEM